MQSDKTSPIFEMIISSPDGMPAVSASRRIDNSNDPELNWENEHQEGQLAVDVAETNKEIIVVSTMAGAVADKIHVVIHNDLITIRGVRRSPLEELSGGSFVYNECYWGAFSRSIVSPVHIVPDFARAEYKNGVLTVRIPKRNSEANIPIVVIDD